MVCVGVGVCVGIGVGDGDGVEVGVGVWEGDGVEVGASVKIAVEVGACVGMAVGGAVKPLDEGGGGVEFEQAASVKMKNASAAIRDMDDSIALGLYHTGGEKFAKGRGVRANLRLAAQAPSS